MITTDKSLVEFIRDYEIVHGHELNSDFRRCYPIAKDLDITIENRYLILRNHKHQLDIYVDEYNGKVDIAISKLHDPENVTQREYTIHWFNENHYRLCEVVQEMLLNLS